MGARVGFLAWRVNRAVIQRPMGRPYFPSWRAFCAPLGAPTARARGAAESIGGLAILWGGFFAGWLVPARRGRRRDSPAWKSSGPSSLKFWCAELRGVGH